MTQPQPRSSTPNLHSHVTEKVLRLVPEVDAHILDLGCGSGALLNRLACLGYRNLTGVDIRPPASSSLIRYVQADLDQFSLNAAEGSFDFVLAVELIEHIENLGLFLSELSRLLKPGGLALFTTPNLHSVQAKVLFLLRDRLKQFDSKGDPTHVAPIVLFTIARLMNRHGLQILESWGFPLDGSSPTSRRLMQLAVCFLRPLFQTCIHGDNLCLLVKRDESFHNKNYGDNKAFQLTAHYYSS